MLFGAHVSSAGGIHTAIDRAQALKANAVQVFTQSPRMWKATTHSDESVARFHERRPEARVESVICHATYLINLGTTDDTIYRIGSITKQFTAVMLLQSVAQGKVHLSDPVEKFYPEVKEVAGKYTAAPPITLIQLATHHAGLSEEPDEDGRFTTGPVSQWEQTLITALPKLKYEQEPGTRFIYSNIGYAILGAALSRAAG